MSDETDRLLDLDRAAASGGGRRRDGEPRQIIAQVMASRRASEQGN
jgi:hypothetical protein